MHPINRYLPLSFNPHFFGVRQIRGMAREYDLKILCNLVGRL
jgi:hypothetical protein